MTACAESIERIGTVTALIPEADDGDASRTPHGERRLWIILKLLSRRIACQTHRLKGRRGERCGDDARNWEGKPNIAFKMRGSRDWFKVTATSRAGAGLATCPAMHHCPLGRTLASEPRICQWSKR